MEERIPLATPTMHGEELEHIREAFARNYIAPVGFHCDAFEEEMIRYLYGQKLPQKAALALNSGTAALHLAVKLAGVRPGDIVLCSDMTFAATVNPISYEGGVQVFVDCEAQSWNMDPAALERAFEKYPQAKVVMLAHLYGTPAQMDAIAGICRRHHAVLIEDAAEALAAEYQGKLCGTFGDYGVLSFNGNKLITTSGGGMLLTVTEAQRQQALHLATQAKDPAPWYQHSQIGYNYRLSNVLAGIGRGQLKYVREHRDRKEAIYRRYAQGLSDLPVTMNPFPVDAVPNFWLSCITVNPGCHVSPMHLMDVLAKHNVEARPIWKPMHLQPVFADCDFIRVADKPVSEDIFARGLCLPSDIKMTASQQDYVIDLIHSCF